MTIIVYSKPVEQCAQCKYTYRFLDDRGIKYKSIDITDPANSDAYDKVISLGYAQVPVVVTPNEHWSGFRPDKLGNLVN